MPKATHAAPRGTALAAGGRMRVYRSPAPPLTHIQAVEQ